MGQYLPAGVGGFPLQYVLCERWRLQLILVKGHLVYNHGLRIQTGETNMWVGWTWRLDGTRRGMVNTYKWTAFYSFFLYFLSWSVINLIFLNTKGPKLLIDLSKVLFLYINIYKDETLSYYFFHKKLIMSKYLPELESSGQARRPQEWASGQWAHRF